MTQWKDWDTPDNLPHQPIQGPPTKIMAGLLTRISQDGPQIPSVEEWQEINWAEQRRIEWENSNKWNG